MMNTTIHDFPLPGRLASKIKKISTTLQKAGYECFIVGGAVRDMIAGHKAHDFDFATNARPQEILKIFKRVIPTGIKHGTVTVLLGNDPFEITTYRADGKYVDGRRPEEVYYSDTLKEDIIRRDFTMNGLAYNVLTGEVIDYVGGVKDISGGIIRTINNPLDRLSEDGLRSYRACRFASKFHFIIEEHTFAAITQTLDISAKVSAERIRDELMKIMATEQPSVGLEYLRTSGLLKQCLPELDAAYGVEQNRFHSYDVYYHCLYSCDAAPVEDPLLRFAALLHDIGKVPCRNRGSDGDYTFYNHEIVGTRMLKTIMRRLKFSNDEITRACNLTVNHMFFYTPEWTDGAVRRFIRKVGLENLDDLLTLREADRAGNGSRKGQSQPVYELQKRIARIIEKDNAFSIKDLNINGNDLITTFNLSQGKMIGEILNYLLELVLDNPEMNTHEILIKEAEKYLENNIGK